jgi:hypothetical protein
VVNWDNEEPNRPLWTDFKEIFKQEYAVQTNERLILEGLANLAMKPNEMTNELLTRITRTVRVIKESFAGYRAINPDPHNDINHGISNQTFWTFKRQYTNMMFNFFKMNLLKATLTPELRAVVAQQDPEAMTVKKCTCVPPLLNERARRSRQPLSTKSARMMFRLRPWTMRTTWPPLTDEEPDLRRTNQAGNIEEDMLPDKDLTNRDLEPEEEEAQAAETIQTETAGFATFAKSKGTARRNAGNKTKNKPCQDAQGRTYWPMIYFMDENRETKAVNSIYHEDVRYQNEESTFNIAGVQYKPRTVALPQQFLGFQ